MGMTKLQQTCENCGNALFKGYKLNDEKFVEVAKGNSYERGSSVQSVLWSSKHPLIPLISAFHNSKLPSARLISSANWIIGCATVHANKEAGCVTGYVVLFNFNQSWMVSGSFDDAAYSVNLLLCKRQDNTEQGSNLLYHRRCSSCLAGFITIILGAASFIRSFVHVFVLLFVHSSFVLIFCYFFHFVYSFIHIFILSTYPFIYSFSTSF